MRFAIHFISILITVFPTLSVAEETYKLSMLPCYSLDEINRRISPLAEYLAQKSGVKINVIITSDYTQHERQINNGFIEMSFENPYIYTMISETHEVLAMEVKAKDQDKFRGIIIGRKDHRIRKIEDLRGKKISIVSYTSAGGYLSQMLSLMEVGIDATKECTLTEAAENKQENVILAVYTGEADAGFIRESALNQADKYIVANKIMVISRCKWLPNWTFSIKKTLPADIKKRIQAALLELKPNHPALTALQIEKFKISKDSEYDIIRKALWGKSAQKGFK